MDVPKQSRGPEQADKQVLTQVAQTRAGATLSASTWRRLENRLRAEQGVAQPA